MKGDTVKDNIVRRATARQTASERNSPSWPMNFVRRGLMLTRSEPDITIMHRSADAESDRRNLGKPPGGMARHSLDDDNAVVKRCLARMKERQNRHDREQAMRDDDD
jgi:hypothetical protein